MLAEHMCSPVVEMKDICKKFGKTGALRSASVRVMDGDVLGLIGDNGAGKSTLMKILSGYLMPDAGEILWRGKRLRLHSTTEARSIGIEMVYQDLGLVDSLNVAENVFLG